jgi:hypothetical protein
VLDLHWSVISGEAGQNPQRVVAPIEEEEEEVICGAIKQLKLLSLLKLYCVYMHVLLLSSGTNVIYVLCVCVCGGGVVICVHYDK